DVDLSELMVACAPYGGPIATVRDPNHLPRRGSSAGSAAGSAAQARQYISVFSAAGRPISRFLWEPPGGRLMGLGWREDAVGGLVLVTVLEDGTVHQCSMHGKGTLPRIPLHTTNLEGITEAHIFGMRGGGDRGGGGEGGDTGGDGAEGEARNGGGEEEGGRSRGGGGGRVAAGVVCLTESCQLLAMVDFDVSITKVEDFDVSITKVEDFNVSITKVEDFDVSGKVGGFSPGGPRSEPEVFPLADPGLSEPLTGTRGARGLPPGGPRPLRATHIGKPLGPNSFRSHSHQPYPTQQEPEVFPLADPGLSEPPACMAVLEPVMTSLDDISASQVAVLLGTEAALLRVDGETVQRVGAPEMSTAVQRMAVSASGKLLACFTADGQLHVLLTTDLSRRISHYDTQIVLPPDAMAWCGEDAVLLSWQHPPALMLVGPGDAIKYSLGGEEDDEEEEVEGEEEDGEIEGEAGGELSRRRAFGSAALRSVPAPASALDTTTTTTTTDSCLILIPECDGVRLLSSSHSDFISRVPEPTVAAFALASTAPPALLLEAFSLFERRSGKADEHVRAMGVAVMGEAVRGCMQAAAHEGDVDGQKRLLAAAAFGRAFCRKFPRDRMMSLCKDLRVLNAVRRAEEDGLTNGVRAMETAGMPLTYSQYKELSPARLIARLCSTHHHLLALRVAAFLGLRTESVLEHWAISKILSASQMPDEVLYDTIIKQIDTDKRGSLAVSFAAVATVAFHTGRHELATRLLEREVHTGRQVRLLLEMGAFEAALWKAEAGPDADFVFQVLFQLLDKAPEEQVFELLKSHPTARSLFISYCKKSDIPLLMRFYERSSMHQCVAEQIVKQGVQEGLNRWGAERVRELEAAAELLSRTRDHGFQAKAVEDSVKLLRFQQQLEAAGVHLAAPTTTATATGSRAALLLAETTGLARLRDCPREALLLAETAGSGPLKGLGGAGEVVPERRYYWLRLQALARLRDWEGLEKLFKERRPLVGLRAFVEACVEQGAVVEAAKYVGRIGDASEREELSRRLNLPDMTSEAAAAAAAERGEGAILGTLRSFAAAGSAAGAAAVAANPTASSFFGFGSLSFSGRGEG
ncbi:unnamed protein product, partial [Closterium sp. Naga37s-1]